jgi:hypothetical protein
LLRDLQLLRRRAGFFVLGATVLRSMVLGYGSCYLGGWLDYSRATSRGVSNVRREPPLNAQSKCIP